MARTQAAKEIDGFTYSVDQLPGRKSITFLARLGRIVGPSLGPLVKALKFEGKTVDLTKLELEPIGVAIGKLFVDLSETETDAIMRELLQGATYVDGDRIVNVWDTFDLHFKGRPAAGLKLVAFAMEVNYGNFFGALKSAIAMGAETTSK
jgi:hypothetical protein